MVSSNIAIIGDIVLQVHESDNTRHACLVVEIVCFLGKCNEGMERCLRLKVLSRDYFDVPTPYRSSTPSPLFTFTFVEIGCK